MSLIVPPGTRIVARRAIVIAETNIEQPTGSVGVIVDAPSDATHAYRVRFPDGAEGSLRREEFSILKAMKDELTTDAGIYDDVDWATFIIYLPPAEMQWSLYGVPEQLENDETQETYWELQKFLKLALKANPNILECLYSPLVEDVDELAQELLNMREAFLSKLVYQTYNGYVLSQFKKLEQDLRANGSIKWKHAMHLIRLLLSGITVLREHYVPVGVAEHRDQLLAIRNGTLAWEEVNEWRLALHREFNDAFERTTLPERPDSVAVNAFLVKARRSMVAR